jgi:hypothetical protein
MMKKIFNVKLVLFLVLIVFGVLYSPKQETLAAGTPVQVCAVSYVDESILVFINGNSKIYFANETEASRGNWDSIDVSPTDKIAVLDISWLSPNVENIIMIKGDNDQTKSRIILKEKPRKLDVSINYSQLDSLAPTDTIGGLLNIMATEGTGVNPITFSDLQWKKGDTGQWRGTNDLTKELLESYLIKGTNLYFRIAPVDDTVSATLGGVSFPIGDYTGSYAYTKPKFTATTDADDLIYSTDYPDGTDGRRASSEVKLKIARKAVLPVTGIDGEEFTVDIKYGQEYRITATSGGSIVKSVDWTKVTDRTVKKLPLSAMLNYDYDGLTAATSFPEMLIEIRNYSTSKASSSKITATQLDAQRVLPGSIITGAAPAGVTSADKNIYITYNGTKNVNIQIPSASEDNPYEYCVVRQGNSFNLEKASWTSITKGTIVKVLASKAVDFSTLYIRQKEIKYKAEKGSTSAVAFKLASTMQTFQVNYPFTPTAPKMTYTYTKGYPTELNIDVTLNVAGKMPYETALRYLKLGTKDVPVDKVTVTPDISGGIDKNQVYTMRITLKGSALEVMANCTARALGIYYENGTVDKTSSKLTIKNPTAALGLTTTIAQGTAASTTAVTVSNALGTGNHYVYQVGTTQVTKVNTEDKFTTGIAFTSGMDVVITAGQYLTIYELTADDYVVRYKSILVESKDVKAAP